MFPPGHFGIVMILFAPIASVLVVRDLESNLVPGVVAMAGLTLAPDLDALVPGLVHRGLTHSVFAALCLGVLVAGLCYLGSSPVRGTSGERCVFGFAIGSLSIVGHLLGDVITPMGLQPFLPVDQSWYSLSVVYSNDVAANLALFGIGLAVLGATTHAARFSAPTGEEPTDESSVAQPSD